MMDFLSPIFALLLLASACVLHTEAIAVMSVDLGSQWMKIAVVSPGVPMEIVLNKESKRKTPLAVALREDERLFGEDAMTLGIRYPKNNYIYFLDLLGKTIDNPIVDVFKKRFPYYELTADPNRGTVLFQHDSETVYSPEELLAMMLTYARNTASTFASQSIKDAVITVPAFFNMAERMAVLAAAKLSNIKVLQLMNDNAAVALNYGMFRRKDFGESLQHILFYDIGASSTSATIVGYQTVKTKERGFVETNPQFTVLGYGYDRTLGGLEIQLRIRQHLAKVFKDTKKTQTDVFDSPRAMAKLFRQADRVKNVLSANADTLVQVENVMEDQDFKTHMTREEMENLCEDLFERSATPIQNALSAAGMTIDGIDQVILHGAGTRVPRVQAILEKVWTKDLGKSINTDEAAALGAVYHAADLSSGFKVKKFHVKNAVDYPIEIHFQRDIVEEDGSKSIKTVKRNLFPRGNQYPQKKVLTFNRHTDDFNFYVNYGDLSHLSPEQISAIGPLNVSKVSLSKVKEAYTKYDKPNIEAKGIKAHFVMDDSGILNLTYVEAVFEDNTTAVDDSEESAFSKLGSTISSFFSGGEKADDVPAADDKVKNETSNGTAAGNTTETNTTASKNESKATKNETAKPKVLTRKEPIDISEEWLHVQALDAELLDASRLKLEALDKRDKLKIENEQAKNNLESFALGLKEKLDGDEYGKACSDEHRQEIITQADQVLEWLYEDGFMETTEVYRAKLKDLEKLTKELHARVQEHRDRPTAIQALKDILNTSNLFLGMKDLPGGGPQLITDTDHTALEKLVKETVDWFTKKQTEQESLTLADNPKLLVKDIAKKHDTIARELKYISQKIKIAEAKRQAEEKNKTETKADKAKATKKKTAANKTDEGGEEVVSKPIDEEKEAMEDKIKQGMEEDQMQEEEKDKIDESEAPNEAKESGEKEVEEERVGIEESEAPDETKESGEKVTKEEEGERIEETATPKKEEEVTEETHTEL